VQNTAEVFVTFSPRIPRAINVEFVDKVTFRPAYLRAVGWVASANIITLIIHISSSPLRFLPVVMQDSYSGIILQSNAEDLSVTLLFTFKPHFKSRIDE
jgi:hypothetical protein